MKDELTELKTVQDDNFQVEFSMIPAFEIVPQQSDLQAYTQHKIDKLDDALEICEKSVIELNTDIDRLSNHADGLDYTIAVSSGILSGLLDSIFVGDWDFSNARAVTDKEINKKVTDFAKKDPEYYEWLKKNRSQERKDADRLENAIAYLEKKFPLPGDGAYNGNPLSTNITHKTHRLDDFCHHPTVVGLICCIIVQFKEHTIYSDKTGTIIDQIPVTVNDYGEFIGKNPVAKLFSGIINWFITVAKTAANRHGHLMSDIATPAGLPGSFMSIMKELSALPVFRKTDFAEKLRRAFQNGIGSGEKQISFGLFDSLFEGAKSSRLDLRTESAVKHELKRQAKPVIFNEVIVRAVYFIRRFIEQIRIKGEMLNLDWKAMLPINNRTITRMLTISTGTFAAVDLTDAAIRAAIKSGGNSALFAKSFILKVNFVGVGRFFVAVGVDVKMGVEKSQRRYDRVFIYNQMLMLTSSKVYYRQAQIQDLLGRAAENEYESWRLIKANEQSLEELFRQYDTAVKQFFDAYQANQTSIKFIAEKLNRLEEKNEGLIEELFDVL